MTEVVCFRLIPHEDEKLLFHDWRVPRAVTFGPHFEGGTLFQVGENLVLGASDFVRQTSMVRAKFKLHPDLLQLERFFLKMFDLFFVLIAHFDSVADSTELLLNVITFAWGSELEVPDEVVLGAEEPDFQGGDKTIDRASIHSTSTAVY